jgi:hypothetical protein
MHPITRWVNDDGIGLSSPIEEFSSKYLCLIADEFHIFHTVSTSIFFAISTRISDELDRVYSVEILGEEDTDRPCSSIEIEKYSSLMFYSIYRASIESLGTIGIHLEEGLWLDFECESEEFLCDRRFP